MALDTEQCAWLMPTREMRSAPPHPFSEKAAAVAGRSYFLIKPADGIRTLRASLLHTFCTTQCVFPLLGETESLTYLPNLYRTLLLYGQEHFLYIVQPDKLLHCED